MLFVAFTGFNNCITLGTHVGVGKLTSCPIRGPACRRNDATTRAKTLMVNLHPRLAMIDEVMATNPATDR